MEVVFILKKNYTRYSIPSIHFIALSTGCSPTGNLSEIVNIFLFKNFIPKKRNFLIPRAVIKRKIHTRQWERKSLGFQVFFHDFVYTSERFYIFTRACSIQKTLIRLEIKFSDKKKHFPKMEKKINRLYYRQ